MGQHLGSNLRGGHKRLFGMLDNIAVVILCNPEVFLSLLNDQPLLPYHVVAIVGQMSPEEKMSPL